LNKFDFSRKIEVEQLFDLFKQQSEKIKKGENSMPDKYEVKLVILLDGDFLAEFEVTKLKFEEIHWKHGKKEIYKKCKPKDDLCALKTLLYTIAREDNVYLSFARTEANINAAEKLKEISQQHDINEDAQLEWAYLYIVKSGGSEKDSDPKVNFKDLRIYNFHIEDGANYRMQIRGDAVKKNL
jgi:hypothetical protein